MSKTAKEASNPFKDKKNKNAMVQGRWLVIRLIIFDLLNKGRDRRRTA
jgi:hypothetical protein